jgi:hypothetical protein
VNTAAANVSAAYKSYTTKDEEALARKGLNTDRSGEAPMNISQAAAAAQKPAQRKTSKYGWTRRGTYILTGSAQRLTRRKPRGNIFI